MDDTPVLELQQVTKRYGRVTAVNRSSFQIMPGEVFTLLGPSGCGKSTTLRLVAGLEEPDEGKMLLRGRTMASAGENIFLPSEKRNMGMVFQSYAIWPHMTVMENVAFPLRLRHWPKQKVRDAVHDVLALVGLEGLEPRPATMLSGGQQQRVALARALVYNPDILLLDEPLSNLDAKLREHMRLEIRSLQRRLGIAVLFVTHDQSEAMAMSDRVAVMNGGHIEQIGSPMEAYERPASAFVRDFLGRAITLPGTARRERDAAWVEIVGLDARLTLVDGTLDNYPDQTKLVLSCRPEDIRLLPAGSAPENSFRAVVDEVLYLGELVEHRVRTATGQLLLLSSPRQDRRSIGDEVDLVIDSKMIRVWPEERAAATEQTATTVH